MSSVAKTTKAKKTAKPKKRGRPEQRLVITEDPATALAKLLRPAKR